jgi:hypothetical protein
MEQITAPCAWRAISPVSNVTWWLPYEKVFLMGFTGILESKKRSSSDERWACLHRPGLLA